MARLDEWAEVGVAGGRGEGGVASDKPVSFQFSRLLRRACRWPLIGRVARASLADRLEVCWADSGWDEL